MKTTHKINGLLTLLTLHLATSSFGQYTQNVTNTMAPGANLVEKSAIVTTFATFKEAVGLAWTNNSGGVFNFPTTITPNTTTVFRGNYGTNSGRMQITSSVNMQNITSSAASFTVLSAPNGTTSTADQNNYLLTFGLFDTNSGLPLVNEVLKQIGFVILSRNNAATYPLDLRATVTFSDDSTEVVTSVIGLGSGTDETFFGFTAPNGLAISSLRFQSFVPNTETPVAARIAWDDFGFITGPSTATPAPQIINFNPAAFAIHSASNGLQFEALTYVAIDPTNVSLVVNSIDVSSQLVFTGDPTNYSIAYNGLVPDQEYNVTVSVTNSAGVATLNRTFYTITGPFPLYNSEGFTDDTLYPLGSLQSVTHGRGTWVPHAGSPTIAAEPAQIVDVGGTNGKVLERASTGASRADFLFFPPVSSGTIVIEFDAFVSTTAGRTIDISLQPTTGGTTMASSLVWGTNAGKLSYFDNVNWIAIADLEPDWHRVKIVNFLSGPAAGKFDIFVNETAVGQKLPWRNATIGSAFNQFRIQTQDSAAPFQSGQIDNLVITAAPENTNVVLPPAIVNLIPAERSIIRPEDGIQFNVTSAIAIGASNVVMFLNGVPVDLVVSEPSTNLVVSYDQLTAGNHSIEIQASSAAGITTLTRSFIATTDGWLVAGDGWASPWEWNSGNPLLQSNPPMDAAYLNLNTTGGPRNLMRQYQSGAVDITKPHYIRWKFRLTEPDFDSTFAAFNDRVHFFAHPTSRLGASTTTGNSWAILAAGAANVGVAEGKTFWVFDNVEGNGTFNLANHVDSFVPLRPEHIYSFEILTRPDARTYSVKIVDETGGTSFTSAAPHRFRDTNPAAVHPFLHFGVQANTGATVRGFDLDSVSITQAAISVLLSNPVRNGSTVTFSFASQAGFSHVAQYRESLASGTWQLLETIPGDGSTKLVVDPNPSPETRFYRVITQ